jgi:hypothetical protein
VAKFDVFVSHSAEDKDFVRRLRVDLEVCGYKLWVDETYLRVGDALSSEIEQAIRDSRFLAAVHSRHSAASEWVRRECAYAAAQGVPVIPVVLDRESITHELRELVYADFSRPDDQPAYHRAFHDMLTLLGTTSSALSELAIYSSGLSPGWLNSSWDATSVERYTLGDGDYVTCFRAELFRFGGIAFVFRSGIDTAPFSYLCFSLHGGQRAGQKMKVFVNDQIGNGIRNQVRLQALPPNSWRSYSVSLKYLDAERSIIFKVNWSHATGALSGPICLADVRLTKRKPRSRRETPAEAFRGLPKNASG